MLSFVLIMLGYYDSPDFPWWIAIPVLFVELVVEYILITTGSFPLNLH